ncbi:hypothetical protein MBH78_19555 [Oceanimonas sp. NS1]|nr:hypothetical protein [Oceanimonas sp. NS1]
MPGLKNKYRLPAPLPMPLAQQALTLAFAAARTLTGSMIGPLGKHQRRLFPGKRIKMVTPTP